jgi:hypothetical protein
MRIKVNICDVDSQSCTELQVFAIDCLDVLKLMKNNIYLFQARSLSKSVPRIGSRVFLPAVSMFREVVHQKICLEK